jgi:toxin ParE1/3/4
MIRRKLVVTSLAEDDLAEIWCFIAADDPEAADRFVAGLQTRCQLLADAPEMGRARPELAAGLRGFPVDRYVILYRVRADVIEIVRVVSGYRDLEGLL